eukprot:gene21609-53123_t
MCRLLSRVAAGVIGEGAGDGPGDVQRLQEAREAHCVQGLYRSAPLVGLHGGAGVRAGALPVLPAESAPAPMAHVVRGLGKLLRGVSSADTERMCVTEDEVAAMCAWQSAAEASSRDASADEVPPPP